MAEPGKGAQEEEVERRAVELAEIRAGVKLRPDRRVVLTVKDLAPAEPAAGSAAGGAAGEETHAAADETPAAAGESSSSSAQSEGASTDAGAEKEAAPETNFHVQLELPDGSDYARNKSCVLEIPGHPSVQGKTNESGELTLSVPNVTVEGATLRVLDDGGAEIASWPVTLRAADDAAKDAQPDAGSAA